MLEALLWAILLSVSNTFTKSVSVKFDIFKSIAFQNGILIVITFFVVLYLDLLDINLLHILPYLAIIWITWFIWTYLYYISLKYINAWIVITIANLYIFWSYFLNAAIVWEQELLSWGKILLSITFFILTTIFVLERNNNKHISLNKKMLYPLWTAVCWIFYSSYRNYLVKETGISVLQWMFYSQSSLWLFAIISYVIQLIRKKTDINIKTDQILSYSWVSIFMFLWTIFIFQWYARISWNLVNIIALSQIPILSVMSYMFLKDRLTRKQVIIISLMLINLILFFVF